jgi:hypothetical protein
MTTLTIKLNERTKAGKAFLAIADFFKDSKGIEIIENPEGVNEKSPKISKNTPNDLTLKIMKETEEGLNLTKTDSHKDLMDKLFS